MSKKLFATFFIFIFSICLVYGAKSNEKAEVKKLLNEYMDSVYKADVGRLKKIFHAKATMNGYLLNDMIIGTPDIFYQDLASKPSMESEKTNCRYVIKDLEIEGNIAKATLHVTGFFGVFTIKDYLHLIKDGDSWKIICKTFTTI